MHFTLNFFSFFTILSFFLFTSSAVFCVKITVSTSIIVTFFAVFSFTIHFFSVDHTLQLFSLFIFIVFIFSPFVIAFSFMPRLSFVFKFLTSKFFFLYTSLLLFWPPCYDLTFFFFAPL